MGSFPETYNDPAILTTYTKNPGGGWRRVSWDYFVKILLLVWSRLVTVPSFTV